MEVQSFTVTSGSAKEQTFQVFKFCSMHVDSQRLLQELLAEDPDAKENGSVILS